MARLIYIHDPMCSWCWGFSAVLKRLLDKLSGRIEVIRLLGGLAKDTNEIMPIEMQDTIISTWHRIESVIPDVKFNYDFWHRCQPRRSTYPACRAVIAARQQDEAFDIMMTAAIQQAYYQQARNPSEDEILIELASELRLDVKRFSKDLLSSDIQDQLMEEIAEVERLGVDSYPSLVLQTQNRNWHIPVNYTDVVSMQTLIEELLLE